MNGSSIRKDGNHGTFHLYKEESWMAKSTRITSYITMVYCHIVSNKMLYMIGVYMTMIDPVFCLAARAPSLCSFGGCCIHLHQAGAVGEGRKGKIMPRRWLWTRPGSSAHSLRFISLVSNSVMATSNLKTDWEMLMNQWAQEVQWATFSHLSMNPL